MQYNSIDLEKSLETTPIEPPFAKIIFFKGRHYVPAGFTIHPAGLIRRPALSQ
jgi:hypothetical protein